MLEIGGRWRSKDERKEGGEEERSTDERKSRTYSKIQASKHWKVSECLVCCIVTQWRSERKQVKAEGNASKCQNTSCSNYWVEE